MPEKILSGGGEMGDLMRTINWESTPLGGVNTWPQSLRTALSILLTSKAPIFLWWGPHLVQFYNNAYRPILGSTKHPKAMGQAGRECWAEIWDIIGPMIDHVFSGGSTAVEDGLLLLNRNGYLEEGYFNYAYSPIRGESSKVDGVFCVCLETTAKVVGERRLCTLKDLASRARRADSVEEACRIAAETLATNQHDIPFAALYLYSPDRLQASRAGICGIAPGQQLFPALLRIADLPLNHFLSSWATVSHSQSLDLSLYAEQLPTPIWNTPPSEAILLPITLTGDSKPIGFAILGASACKRLDDDYRTFMSLVVSHIESAVAEARAFEYERQRADALAELDRAKTKFFANVSHEFRTPLTLLLGPLEDALKHADSLPLKVSTQIGTAHRNALRMLRLVNSLLDFARVEAGRAKARYEATDLSALTAQLASHFSSATERAGLSLNVECDALPEPVWVDREMWEKIVLNLLSNAFKFTFNGSIDVHLRASNEKVRLSVKDSGIGIAQSELPHLFQRFHRVEGARGRSFEGTGIGLALVQELVRMHGGAISVESEPDRGSTFTVVIPFGKAHLPAEAISDSPAQLSTSAYVDSYFDESLDWISDSSQISPLANTAANLSTRKTILVADDNADMRAYLERLLAPLYRVITARDGDSAFDLVLSEQPDLLLSDVMMPGLDGFSLLKKLRSKPDTSAMPIILLSARAGEEAGNEGRAAGADDYLVKPFTANELLARVNSHLRLAEARKDAEQRATLILESITDAFFACDAEWRYTYANAEAERLTGIAREEIIGRQVPDVFSDKTGAVLLRELDSASLAGSDAEFSLYSHGRHRWYRVRTYPSKQGGWSLFFRDITHEREVEENLRRSNEDLEQFAYIASHDLQEPLRAVRIYSQLLSRRYAGQFDAEADQFLARLVDGGQRMERLIRDLLSFAGLAIDQGPFEQLDIKLILEESLANLAQALREAKANVTLGTMPVVTARNRQLVHVFQNLLSNALKYTKPDTAPEVKVSAERQNEEWVFSVSDNGVGIAAEYHDKVFDLFSRFHGRTVSGSGIGLAAVRRIVEHHRGRVWVESVLGAGSTFFFTLPASAHALEDSSV